jgi:hypothetical protein
LRIGGGGAPPAVLNTYYRYITQSSYMQIAEIPFGQGPWIGQDVVNVPLDNLFP